MKFISLYAAIVFLSASVSCGGQVSKENTQQVEINSEKTMSENQEKIIKSEEEWRKELTPGQFRIIREKGTESPFTGKFYKHTEKGMYVCAACGAELFASGAKYNSGCGWPSFFEAIKDKVDTVTDKSHGMTRIEITCKRCGGHLGHVFDDGPQPTGLRYCVNSESLDFKKE